MHAIKRARTNLESARSIDARLAKLSDQLSAAYYELEDISESIKQYQNNLKFDPLRLEAIQQRLAELQKLKRKYGPEISDVVEKLEHAKESLDRFAHTDEDVAEREKELKSKKIAVLESALQISEKRNSASKKMAHSIEEIVRNLGMPEVHVSIRLVKISDENGAYRIGPDGIDEVEFFIAPNPGEPERPLYKIASGGELSRFALALKAVLASRDDVETLVFDEIDTGIGGQVGVAVGNYLRQLSEFCQVLCVTHLATIAARAHYQWKVDKRIEGGRTVMQLSLLSREEREAEIARMLSGSSESEASRVHAAELLDQSFSASK
jgi:DNA repair protein RecN (Recombination protein N)